MKQRTALALILLALCCGAAQAQVQLVVAASEFGSPVYVTHAGDGSNRLYVVERGGVVRVVPLGQTVGTAFLDVRRNVVSGNEQGLLGLAFHPDYATNGRLFVYYTRVGDGALVVSEFARSADPLIAAAGESIVLVIPHPGFANHNGGMLAFGPDGYLYIGTGDGGSANDPPNNAQNPDSLLGKILRIDVDRPDTALGIPYSAPADNPFVAAPGRDEIYASGFRNPWRFSFDRDTGALWVGDVGQGAREEVNAGVQRGANYGWRVYEGTACTNNDPTLCNPASFVPPTFEYGHVGERCSVTGGYVYRGARTTVTPGTYVYGDYCTGEIFVWDGVSQQPLLTVPGNLASFGEDEQGELYAVALDGTIYRIAGVSISPAVEFFHDGFGHYFTTTFVNEIAALDAGTIAGWTRTGQSFGVYVAGTPGRINVCRFFSASYAPKSSHFYTPFVSECERVQRNPDWEFEGEVFAITPAFANGTCPAGQVPLFRVYNDGIGGAPNHRYTPSVDVRASMLRQGWIAEGFGPNAVFGCTPA